MINTYDASLRPPPVPPRHGSQSSTRNQTRSHARFLSAAFVVQTVVTVVLFIYLFQRIDKSEDATASHSDLIVLKRLEECGSDRLDRGSLLDCKKVLEKFQSLTSKVSQTKENVDSLSAPDPHSGSGTVAQMKVQQPSRGSTSKILCWNRDHSTLKNVDYFSERRMLHIRISGYYYVYSQVTFSRSLLRIPLAQTVMRRRSAEDVAGEDLLFKAFCSLRSGEVCTSYHGGVVRLEEGQRLYVNVTDLSLVNFDVTATTFGLFLLQRNP